MKDITTFFDINSSYKKVSLKLGSFEFYHNIFNIKSECWEPSKTSLLLY